MSRRVLEVVNNAYKLSAKDGERVGVGVGSRIFGQTVPAKGPGPITGNKSMVSARSTERRPAKLHHGLWSRPRRDDTECVE